MGSGVVVVVAVLVLVAPLTRPLLLDLPTVPVVRLGLVFEDCQGAVQLVGVVTWNGLRRKRDSSSSGDFPHIVGNQEIILRSFVGG